MNTSIGFNIWTEGSAKELSASLLPLKGILLSAFGLIRVYGWNDGW